MHRLTGISRIVETAAGDLWLHGDTGVTHILHHELEHWMRDARYAVRSEELDYLDGLPGSVMMLRPTPSAFEGHDGRLWFITSNGLFSVDPVESSAIPCRPLSQCGSNAGNVRYAADATPIDLPPLTSRFRIEYTAGSLTVPERVRFRYRLEGLDDDWQDGGDRREAIYTNLPPGRYRFRVIACNNDGVWNLSGTSLDFSIRAAFYQTACSMLWGSWRLSECSLYCTGTSTPDSRAD